jgi:hypothetical protein
MKKISLLIAVLFLTSACSLYRISSRETTLQYYPSKESADEVIYLENIDRPVEYIGEVVVNAERRQRISDVLEKMKHEAAIIGGDAITEIKTDATGAWKQLPAQEFIGNGYIRANFIGKVVVFR